MSTLFRKPPQRSSGPESSRRRDFREDEILNFLLKTKRLDISLTEEQLRANEGYARAHSKRFAMVLNSFGPLVRSGAKIFSIGSMPNHLELLFVYYFDAEIIGSTYSPIDRRDNFIAEYEFPDGTKTELIVFLRDLCCDKMPVAAFSCDVVFCFEAVEHLYASPAKLFREARGVLCPGGFLLLSTPNQQHWHRILHAINGITYPDTDFSEPIESRHTHIFSYRELERFLIYAGFSLSEYFFTDPWGNARHGKQFDMKELINKSVKDLLSGVEYQGEDIFIAASPSNNICVFTDGWHDLENDGANWWRWSAGSGRLEMYVEKDVTIEVKGELYSSRESNTIEISVNGEKQQTIDITWHLFQPLTPVSLSLKRGNNIVEFVSQKEALITQFDNRPLAFALKNLTITLGKITFQLHQ